MELKEFLEKFLPDYLNKWTTAINEAPDFYDDELKELWACYDLFPKALSNFETRFSAEQRYNCYEAVRGKDYTNSYSDVRGDIVEAEQPKIEEL